MANFDFLRDPLFWGPRMRRVIGIFTFCMCSQKVVILCFCKDAYKYAKIGKEETKKKKREERKKKRRARPILIRP